MKEQFTEEGYIVFDPISGQGLGGCSYPWFEAKQDKWRIFTSEKMAKTARTMCANASTEEHNRCLKANVTPNHIYEAAYKQIQTSEIRPIKKTIILEF